MWKHVKNPILGMITNDAASDIPPDSSPFAKGVYIKDGEVRSDFGMTNYPVPGVLKTNALLGTVMKIETFRLFSGVSYLLAFTTRYLYQFNTVTSTWDVVIQGTLIDDCETAFTASANVTSTRDTAVKLRGTYSSKNVIATGFTTGIVSYHNFTSLDISSITKTHLSFWVYCDTTLSSGVFRLRISEQNAGGTGATYADYTIPIITASTWQHVSVVLSSPVASSGGTYPNDLNAVLSVALVAQSDPGAVTIYLDDIRTAKEFTGDEDNRFSFTVQRDVGIITNGVDAPTQVTDSSGVTHAALTLSLPSGAITTSEVVLAFKDHVLYMNNTENGADVPQRVSWSDIGTTNNHIAGTSGFQDLTDDDSWIVGAAILSENEVAIYKEKSIVQCIWIGGHTPFRFTTIITDKGAISKDCIAVTSGYHTVASPNDVYVYKGDNNAQSIIEVNKEFLFSRLDGTYEPRCFLSLIKEDDEIQFWIPVNQTTPDEGYTLYFGKTGKPCWYIKSRNISTYGFYQSQTALTIGDLVGTIGEQNYTFGSTLNKTFSPITLVGDVNGKVYKLDKASLNNAGVAISSEFQTPDFICPDTSDYLDKEMRVAQFIYEAAGQIVTSEWSDDSGSSWNPTQGSGTNVSALDGVFRKYQQDFESTTGKIRFRFTKNTLSQGFKLRYYGIYWKPRSGRV